VRDGQTWTHSTPLVVATFPVDVKQTLTASAPSAGRAELALDAHGETLIGDTGVTLAITATGRSVVDPRSSDVPLALKTTYRCAATGGPGLDSESVVTISITTSLKTDRS
jgi:hypothetical protein